MNRRQFFKQIGVVCAAAIATPTVLIAEKKHGGCVRGDRSKYIYIMGQWYNRDDVPDLDLNAPVKWKNYYTVYNADIKEPLNAMRRLSELHRTIVKQARQRQIQNEKQK